MVGDLHSEEGRDSCVHLSSWELNFTLIELLSKCKTVCIVEGFM